MSAVREAAEAFWNKNVGSGLEVERNKFAHFLAKSPVGSRYPMTDRLLVDFIQLAVGKGTPSASPAPAAAPAKTSSMSSRIPGFKAATATPKTMLGRSRGRASSPSPTREGRSSPTPKPGTRLYGVSQFVVACEELPAYADALFSSTIIVGNGRSVLNGGAGACVDKFDTVIRFNDYQISGFENDVGRKVDVWCVSDWTCAKLFNKYPERELRTLIAIPYKFMGKP